uniref:P66_CC domain-containing protein n=1 Tax=Bursaphelenchus xylophilus TaxID=6326 RepID=A0A1I7SH15_BURXY
MVDSQVVQNGVSHTDPLPDLPIKTAAADAETIESPKKKKRKLSGGANLDQYDCAFGIKVDEDGDVVAMTEDSELSSLNEEELKQVREKWEEYKSQLEGMNDEKTRERELQTKELEAALRNEEALLAMLKKTRQKQLVAKTLQTDPKLMSNIPQNSTGAAYKPAMAAPIAAKLNGVAKPTRPAKPQKNGVPVITPSQQAVLQKLLESKQLRPEHIQQLATMAGPQFNAIIQQLAAGQQKQQEQQREREAELAKKAELARKEQERKNAAAAAAAAALEAERQAKLSEQTQQQKINAARNQLRRHLEQHLLQLAPPKAPSNDMSFVPNPSQPDFCYLLGLDLVVQRNLKDKTVFKKVEFEPYVCEECGTDFTPNWKAIAGDKGDLHVYCEQCVKQAQKRKVRNERTSLYKKVFQKIAEQEKEFERQVQAGKFNEASSSTATSSHSNGISTPTSKNTSNFNAAALSGLSGAAKALNQSAASLAAAAGSGASPASLAARSFQNSLRNTMNGSKDLKKPTATPTTSSSSSANRKRPNSSTNSQMQQLMNAMIQNPQMAQQMQQLNQLSMLRSNPMMLSAIMSNPQMLAVRIWDFLKFVRVEVSLG